jgi:NAD(P)-dependent dehydrogenase (short-subunit alcohol dehydrogenase family)
MGIQLEGKVLLVTGGGSGIGRAVALGATAGGAKVAVVDWDQNAADETAALIKSSGGEALAIKADVSRAADVEMMVSCTVEAYGRIDSAVNNAGVQGLIKNVVDCSDENWDLITSVNLKGVFLSTREEIRQMLKQGGGRIVNVSSNMGLIGHRGMCAYSASKHGVIGFSKTAALEYAKSNILVNVVCPGPTDTGFATSIAREQPEIMEELMKGAEHVLVMGRLAAVEEVANAILFCCSDDAQFMVGSIISVDGGYVAQ